MRIIILIAALLIGYEMSTQNIRNLVAEIIAACDAIDAGTPTPPPAATFQDNLAGAVPPATGLTANPTNWLSLRNTFRTTMKNAPSGSILFIGDSQIANWDISLVTQNGVNLGISGESSRHLLARINETDIDGQPNLIHRAGAVVIETFVNDLGDQVTYSSSAIANDTVIPFMLARLAGWVSGKVVIICPTKVGQKMPAFWTSNTAIETLNTAIKNKFANRTDVVVIDINPTIAPNGWLLPEYSNDYHHLNTGAQQIKADATKAALTSLNVIY
jgi:hypothetical protein